MSDNASEDSSHSSYLDYQSFQLKPLAEMEVVGACRRGRRRGRKNRSVAERQSEIEQRRQSKNARERLRVENVKNEYAKLQRLLGLESECQDDISKEKRRHCKLRTLTAATQRIRDLLAERNQQHVQEDVVLAAAAVTPPRNGFTHRGSTLQPSVKTVNSSPSNANVDYTSHYSHHIPNYVGMTSSGYTRDDATLSLCPSHSIVALNQDVNSPSHPLPPFCTIPPFMEMQVPPHRLNLPPAANYPWYPLSPEPLPGPHGFPHSVPGPDGLSHYTHFPISCQSTPYVDSWPLPSYSAPLHAHK